MAIISKPDMTNLWASGGAVIAPSPSKVQTGWTAEIPPHQWENWVQHRQDEAIAYLFQRGIAEWDSGTEYQANKSFVSKGGTIYVAITTNTNKDPEIETNDWKRANFTIEDLATVAVTGKYSDLVEKAPNASTTVGGVVKLATNTETQTGDSATLAVTPASLSSRTALESRTGLVQLATTAEAQALTNDANALTPKKLGDAMNAHVLGMGQTWQDMTASRALGVTYTNTTGRAIYIAVSFHARQSTTEWITVDGVNVVGSIQYAGSSIRNSLSTIIPANSTYSCSGGPLEKWSELR